MSTPCKPPSSNYTLALGALSTIAAPLVVLRVLVAMGVITITSQAANAVTSVATVLAMASAFGVGWRRSVLLSRAERSALIRRIDVLERRVDNSASGGATSVHYLPPRVHQPYRPIAVGSEGDPVPLLAGMDPETAAALRRIDRRLRKVNGN